MDGQHMGPSGKIDGAIRPGVGKYSSPNATECVCFPPDALRRLRYTNSADTWLLFTLRQF